MEDKKKFKLIKSKKENDKVIHSDNKKVIANDINVQNGKYLKDYYQIYRFVEGILEDGDKSNLLLLLSSIDDMIMGIIQLSYENEIIKNDGIPLKDILKSNKEFIEKMKIEITKYKANPNKSYMDDIYFSEIEEVIIQNSSNLIEACIYKSELLERINTVKDKLNTNFFNLLSQKELYLGTKAPSKGKTKNINIFLAKIYYEIICNDELKAEFIDAIEKKKNINECSYPVQVLFSKLNKEALINFRKYVDNRDIIIESLLLMYIINDSIFKYKPKDFEKYYNEYELEALSNNAIEKVATGIDDMYLSLRYSNDFLNK